MQFAVAIEDREVVAAGSLVLGAADRNVTFDLDGMKFELRLVPGSTALEVQFIRDDVKRLIIEFKGLFPELTAAWKLSAIAETADRQIDLDVMIYSQSGEPDCVRQLAFSFTATPAKGQGWATPAPIRFR